MRVMITDLGGHNGHPMEPADRDAGEGFERHYLNSLAGFSMPLPQGFFLQADVKMDESPTDTTDFPTMYGGPPVPRRKGQKILCGHSVSLWVMREGEKPSMLFHLGDLPHQEMYDAFCAAKNMGDAFKKWIATRVVTLMSHNNGRLQELENGLAHQRRINACFVEMLRTVQ